MFLAGCTGDTATGQQQAPQERQVISLEHRKPVRQYCRSAEKAIRYYRARTWEHQDMMGRVRYPTLYPERRANACAYKRWVAKRWQTRARNHYDQLQRLLANPYMLARVIVYSIFPRSTAAAALSVVGCETGETYDESAHNSSTDVRGYFQVDSGNHGRVFHWNNQTLVLNSDRLYDPWYNTKVAVFMTKGGVYWNEWHCQPFVGTG